LEFRRPNRIFAINKNVMNKETIKAIFQSIQNRKDLELVFKIAEDMDFKLGYVGDTHEKKLRNIVVENNPLSLHVPRHLSNPSQEDGFDYTKFGEKCREYFSQFGEDVAAMQRIENIYVDFHTAKNKNPKNKTLEDFKNEGYEFHPNFDKEFGGWYAHDLSKPLKIRYIGGHYEFSRLMSLIGGPELPCFSEYSFPAINETTEYVIHSNRKIQFKDPVFATKMRDLMYEKLKKGTQNLIKK
jgi:hypothetical protein